MKKIKVGIVGCGLITAHKYIPGFKKAGAEIAAVCDLNEGLARRIAGDNGVSRYYTDVEKMLADNSLELVSVCTPPATHAKVGLSVLEHNCHLLIEKPMALTVKDCDELINGAKKTGKKICVGHSDLFYPPIIKARELVNDGYIGEFRGMRVLLSTPFDYALSKREHWIHKLPGGILGETGPHTVYLTTPFVKNINEARIITKKSLPCKWTDYDDIRIELKGENGISSIAITHSTNQWDAKVDIFGSKRNLYIDMHKFQILVHDRRSLSAFSVGKAAVKENISSLWSVGGNVFSRFFKRINYGHQLLIKECVKSIACGTPSPVPGEEGREVIRVMEMILGKLQ